MKKLVFITLFICSSVFASIIISGLIFQPKLSNSSLSDNLVEPLVATSTDSNQNNAQNLNQKISPNQESGSVNNVLNKEIEKAPPVSQVSAPTSTQTPPPIPREEEDEEEDD